MTVRQVFVFLSILLPVLIYVASLFWAPVLWLLVIVIPFILIGIYDISQRRRTILRIYPVIGRLRSFFEAIRPEIQQYFVETNTNGQPFNREFRSLVYQRAKGDLDTRPFGTEFDVYRSGYEWVNHSLSPKTIIDRDPRVLFGGSSCSKPYKASPLNISAMSFGALSRNAILALNKGAKEGGFAHNTGEGGISPYHLEFGANLIWQIGTGYFGCRNTDGTFDEALFAERASQDVVKMIEIKLSQGAKPGHGGILPAAKVTREIAEIRHVPMGEAVISPPGHSSFSNPVELLEFVVHLRELSGGKPVGFKLCIGRKVEFLSICKAMLETGITPDFITIDGAEGGTGAAPIELSNSVGTPLRDGLIFAHSALIGTGLRNQLKIIASGKAVSGFHMLRILALGADTVNSARPMMFALGCIQSQRCNTDKCPTGVATQDPARYEHLDVSIKAVRVKNYHRAMIESLLDLLSAAGMETLDDLRPWHINRRMSGAIIAHYDQVYPTITEGCLLRSSDMPDKWKHHWSRASTTKW